MLNLKNKKSTKSSPLQTSRFLTARYNSLFWAIDKALHETASIAVDVRLLDTLAGDENFLKGWKSTVFLTCAKRFDAVVFSAHEPYDVLCVFNDFSAWKPGDRITMIEVCDHYGALYIDLPTREKYTEQCVRNAIIRANYDSPTPIDRLVTCKVCGSPTSFQCSRDTLPTLHCPHCCRSVGNFNDISEQMQIVHELAFSEFGSFVSRCRDRSYGDPMRVNSDLAESCSK